MLGVIATCRRIDLGLRPGQGRAARWGGRLRGGRECPTGKASLESGRAREEEEGAVGVRLRPGVEIERREKRDCWMREAQGPGECGKL